MWKQSVWSSTISATIGSKFLKPGGVLTLTGADAALKGTPGMIGYGLAKAAVHQLTKSLAEEKSGLPENSLVVSILPITLDTPMNRKWMPKADFSTWTSLDFIAEYVDARIFFKESMLRPVGLRGSLYKIILIHFISFQNFCQMDRWKRKTPKRFSNSPCYQRQQHQFTCC